MKILFAADNFFRSRANIVMFERLWKMKPEEHEISLLVMVPLGSLKKKLPSHVTLLNTRSNELKSKKYDSLAVFGNFSCADFAAHRISAKEKSLFIYNKDLTKGEDGDKIRRLIEKFNLVYTSDYTVKSSFLRLYPDLAGRTFIVPDTIELGRINRLAKKDGGYEGFEGMRILTVGPLVPQGGFGILIDTATVLRDRDFYFKWYIIGTGPSARSIESAIEKAGLFERMELKTVANYYPYLDDCDVFVDMNRKGIEQKVLAELKLLDKPVVASNCDFNHDAFGSNSDALLVGGHPVDLADGIEYLMMDE